MLLPQGLVRPVNSAARFRASPQNRYLIWPKLPLIFPDLASC